MWVCTPYFCHILKSVERIKYLNQQKLEVKSHNTLEILYKNNTSSEIRDQR